MCPCFVPLCTLWDKGKARAPSTEKNAVLAKNQKQTREKEAQEVPSVERTADRDGAKKTKECDGFKAPDAR